jgi:diketogulonate reductase-like aldo/keto reductase
MPVQVEEHQGGRWLIGGEVGQNSAWGYVESWATNPMLVPLVSDRATWRVYDPNGGVWLNDPDFHVSCQAPDRDATLYIHAPLSPTISGMYSMTCGVVDDRPSYVHARGGLHLYSRVAETGRRTWIVGEAVGDASGLAFLQEDEEAEMQQQEEAVEEIQKASGGGGWSWWPFAKAKKVEEEEEKEAGASHQQQQQLLLPQQPQQHPPVGAGHAWRVAVDGEWEEDEGLTVVTSDSGLCVDAALKHAPEEAATEDYEAEARAACGRLQTAWEVLRSVRLAPKLISLAAVSGGDAQSPAHTHLSNGMPLPVVGFGAGATAREESEQAVSQALLAGYRLIDGATAYGMEDIAGDLLASPSVAGVGREQVFLTSKLWYTQLGFEHSLLAAGRSLEDYRTDYHDVLLLHWPRCFEDVEWMRCAEEVPAGSVGTWQESWRALERLYAEGAALAIGVSNFDATLLGQLGTLAAAGPHVVQNHRDVVWQDLEAVAACEEVGAFYQAYSSLRGLLGDEGNPHYARAREALARVGERYGGKSVAQVALRWEVQRGHGVIPRSRRPEHLVENLEGVLDFSLSEAEMAEIDALGIHHTQGGGDVRDEF